MKVLKRTVVISVHHWVRASGHCHPLQCAGSWTPLDFPQMLSCSHSLFTRLLKWKLEKGSGHLLITYSSLLPLWSMKKNWQGRQGIVWLKYLKAVLGSEMSRDWGDWFKVSYNIALLKWQEKKSLAEVVSCQELLTWGFLFSQLGGELAFLWALKYPWGTASSLSTELIMYLLLLSDDEVESVTS